MSKKTVTIVAVIVLVMFCMAFVLPMLYVLTASAAPTTLDEAQKNTKDAAAAFNEAKKERDQAEKELDDIKTELEKIQTRISSTQKKISSIDQEIDKQNEEIEKAEKDLEEKNTMFSKRVVYACENGNTDMISIIFESESITDMLNRVEIISQLLEYDKKMITQVEDARAKVVEQKQISEEIKKERLAELYNEQQEKKEYSAKEAESKVAYDKLDAKAKECERQYNAIKAEEDALKKRLAEATQNSTVKYSGGKFSYPVAGNVSISSSFGWRYHPVLRVNKLHTGTDFPVSSGTPIYAAGDGKVVMSGWNTAYGNYIIIDHGGGYATLYAHGSKLVASNGQSVKRGQLIMNSGNTGFSTGPHLHFEVLINGKAVNAMDYL